MSKLYKHLQILVRLCFIMSVFNLIMILLQEIELLFQTVQVPLEGCDDLIMIRFRSSQSMAVSLNRLAKGSFCLPSVYKEIIYQLNIDIKTKWLNGSFLGIIRKEQNSLDPKVICCKLGIVNLQHYTSVLQRLFPHLESRRLIITVCNDTTEHSCYSTRQFFLNSTRSSNLLSNRMCLSHQSLNVVTLGCSLNHQLFNLQLQVSVRLLQRAHLFQIASKSVVQTLHGLLVTGTNSHTIQ